MLVGDRLLVAGSGGTMLALSPYDGSLLGLSRRQETRSACRPWSPSGTVYILTDDADLIALR